MPLAQTKVIYASHQAWQSETDPGGLLFFTTVPSLSELVSIATMRSPGIHSIAAVFLGQMPEVVTARLLGNFYLEKKMASVDPAGSITNLAHLVEVMATHPVGAVFLIILAALVVCGLWVWRNPIPQKPSRKKANTPEPLQTF